MCTAFSDGCIGTWVCPHDVSHLAVRYGTTRAQLLQLDSGHDDTAFDALRSTRNGASRSWRLATGEHEGQLAAAAGGPLWAHTAAIRHLDGR